MPSTPSHTSSRPSSIARRLRDLEATFAHYLPGSSGSSSGASPSPSPYSTPSRHSSASYHQLHTPPNTVNMASMRPSKFADHDEHDDENDDVNDKNEDNNNDEVNDNDKDEKRTQRRRQR